MESLQSFMKNGTTPMKYGKLLSNARFMGVGGSKWWNITKYLNGEDMPEKKEYLSDQWLHYHSSNFHPHLVTVVCSGNGADDSGNNNHADITSAKMTTDRFGFGKSAITVSESEVSAPNTILA